MVFTTTELTNTVNGPHMSLFYQVFHSMSLQNYTYRITEVRFTWSQTLRTLLKAQALSKLEVPNHRPADLHRAWVIWYRAANIIKNKLNLFILCTFISRVFYFEKWPGHFPLFPAKMTKKQTSLENLFKKLERSNDETAKDSKAGNKTKAGFKRKYQES